MVTGNVNATTRLADFAAKTHFDQIPTAAADRAKDCILDYLGVTVAGSSTPASNIVYKSVSPSSEFDGSKTVVIGHGGGAAPLDAALVNSTSAHAVELDDFHRKGSVHPGVSVIPAALAMAQQYKSTGEEIISAVVVGYEVVIRIGMATCIAQFERGFHPTSTCGVFGSAAAAGRLLGLDGFDLANAFGIAGSFAGGIREWKRNGSITKPLQVGRATQNGGFAAVLVVDGYSGPTTVLEGEMGFCHAFANGPDLLTKALEDLLQVFEIENIAFKPYASGRACHPAIDAVLWIKTKENLRLSDIQEVKVKLAKEMYRAVMWPEDRKYEPETVSDAQFSLPFCVAAALTKGSVLLSEFSPESLRDPLILELAKKVNAEVSPECEEVYPEKILQIVEITMKNAKRYDCRVDYSKGDPENPMSRRELREKFVRLAAPTLGSTQTDRIAKIVEKMEDYEDMSELYSFLAGNQKVSQ